MDFQLESLTYLGGPEESQAVILDEDSPKSFPRSILIFFLEEDNKTPKSQIFISFNKSLMNYKNFILKISESY